MSLEARFRAKFVAGDTSECWPWTGATTTAGYGHLRVGGRGEGTIYAHVLAVTLDGRVPEHGLDVHHRCRTRACVNPSHLVVLTQASHGIEHRSTVCKNGHPRAESYVRKATGQIVYCRICRNAARREARRPNMNASRPEIERVLAR